MSAKSRGRHRPKDHGEEHEEHVNHEAWVIPYADMLTLLMALFLVLFAVGRVDTEKFKKLAESFRGEFGSGGASEEVVAIGEGAADAGALDGGASIFDEGGVDAPATTAPLMPMTAAGVTDEALAEAEEQHAREMAVAAWDQLAVFESEVQQAADAAGLGGALQFRLEARGLVVAIVTDQVLFDSGRADLQPAGLQILDIVSSSLMRIDNDIAIEGHSDSRPISTTRYPSNWELSTTRATSVLRYLVDRHGVPADRLSAAGYADTRPIDTHDTAEGQAHNRRVEVVVLSGVSMAPLVAPDGTTPPADDPIDLGIDAPVAAGAAEEPDGQS